jgi:hypothetical protein
MCPLQAALARLGVAGWPAYLALGIENERTTGAAESWRGPTCPFVYTRSLRKSVRLGRLCELDGRDRPFSMMAPNSDSQPVHFI